MSGGQLTLGVKLRDDATLANYIAMPDQGAMLDSLNALCEQRGEAVLYLHGPGQTGKSHLLQACCQAVDEGALYLPLEEIGFTGIRQDIRPGLLDRCWSWCSRNVNDGSGEMEFGFFPFLDYWLHYSGRIERQLSFRELPSSLKKRMLKKIN